MKKFYALMTAAMFLLSTFGATNLAFAASNSNTSLDTNGDGYISTTEAGPDYGSIQASLTTTGDTSADSALALTRFPVADGNGNINYSRTFSVSNSVAQSIQNGEVVVVQHGIDINGNGKYDGSKASSVDSSVPFEATVPTDCGVVQSQGGNGIYKANLSSLNGTNAQGTANVYLNGNNVTVSITASGLSPNLPHAEHFHIGGNNMCPPNTTGVNGNGNNDGNTNSGTMTSPDQQQVTVLRARVATLLGQIRSQLRGIENSVDSHLQSLQSSFGS
jgi:hypothetical protein